MIRVGVALLLSCKVTAKNYVNNVNQLTEFLRLYIDIILKRLYWWCTGAVAAMATEFLAFR